MQLPLGIVGQALGIAILPTLSQQAAENDVPRFKEMVNFGIRMSFFLTLPLAAFLAVLAKPVIAVVFQHARFGPEDTAHAVPSLVCFTLGIGAYSAQAIVARAFYARHDTLTPVLGGMFVAFGIFLPLNYGLFHVANVDPIHRPWLATRGPALATSIGATANFSLLFYLLQRKLGGLNSRRIAGSLARTLAGCAGLIASSWILSERITRALLSSRWAPVAEVLVAGGIGLLVYGAICHALGSEEARQTREMLIGHRRRTSD